MRRAAQSPRVVADVVIAPGAPEGSVTVAPLFEDELVCVVQSETPIGDAREWISSRRSRRRDLPHVQPGARARVRVRPFHSPGRQLSAPRHRRAADERDRRDGGRRRRGQHPVALGAHAGDRRQGAWYARALRTRRTRSAMGHGHPRASEPDDSPDRPASSHVLREHLTMRLRTHAGRETTEPRAVGPGVLIRSHVELRRIELLTSSLRTKRSTN